MNASIRSRRERRVAVSVGGVFFVLHHEMAASIDEVAASTSELSSSAESTSSSIVEMAASVKQVAENVDILSSSAEETTASATQMGASIKEVETVSKESTAISDKVTAEAAGIGMKSVEKTIEVWRKKGTVEKAARVIEQLGGRSEAIGGTERHRRVADQPRCSRNAAILAAQAVSTARASRSWHGDKGPCREDLSSRRNAN
jgi:methyl-accepting chemotaxis protein